MSRMEFRKGILTPVEIIGDVENTAKLIIESMCLSAEELEDFEGFDTSIEILKEIGYKHYYITDTAFYKVDMVEINMNEGLYNAHRNDDGTIGFEIIYYNGGCSFDEAIGDAIEAIK